MSVWPERKSIFRMLPHRPPMVYIDRIKEFNIQKRKVTASRIFSEDDPIFNGHFPQFPIVPGIYLIEGMAQTGIIAFQLTVRKLSRREVPLLTHSDARFFVPVLPGSLVTFEAVIAKATRNAALFETLVRVKRRIAARASMSFGVKQVSKK